MDFEHVVQLRSVVLVGKKNAECLRSFFSQALKDEHISLSAAARQQRDSGVILAPGTR